MVRDILWNALLFAPLFAAPGGDTQHAGPAAAYVAITIAAGVVKSIGAIQSGKAAQRQARYNAQISLQAAYDERRRAESKITDTRRQASLMTGAARASVGGSGIALESRTVGGVLADSKAMAELDVLRIKSDAERAAWGLEAKAESQLYGGRIARSQARYQMYGTLLQTGAQAIGGYQAMGGKGATWSN